MEKQKVNRIGVITVSEPELNSLIRETLDGVRDDLLEAQENVDLYLVAITQESGKEMFGQLYNESLKIKGSARDRQLKLLNMFKDRVGKKEEMDLRQQLSKKETEGTEFNHAELNKMLEEVRSGAGTPSVPQIELPPKIKSNDESINYVERARKVSEQKPVEDEDLFDDEDGFDED